MNDELFVLLISRKLAGEATAQELQELEALLQAHAALRERAAILQKHFTESHYYSSSNTEQALQRTLQKLQPPEQPVAVQAPVAARRRRRALLRTLLIGSAAAAAVVLLLYITGTRQRARPAKQIAAVLPDTAQWLKRQNGKATKAVIELTDGSKIWLNADSRLNYPEVFGNTSREVYLEGEAFFDVANDTRRPFIIHLRKGTIQVLGTSFNIRAYENEPVQTSVTTGKVAFIPLYENNQRRPDTFLITPDVKVTYAQTTGKVVKEATTSADDRAWTEGRLVFKNATLEAIGAELERTFGKKVAFLSDAPRQYRLTGSFQHNSLQDIMYYLARSRAFHYEITDSTLLISE
jgi:ferric-dicitrate binding protein FerR (iron transport regulator)